MTTTPRSASHSPTPTSELAAATAAAEAGGLVAAVVRDGSVHPATDAWRRLLSVDGSAFPEHAHPDDQATWEILRDPPLAHTGPWRVRLLGRTRPWVQLSLNAADHRDTPDVRGIVLSGYDGTTPNYADAGHTAAALAHLAADHNLSAVALVELSGLVRAATSAFSDLLGRPRHHVVAAHLDTLLADGAAAQLRRDLTEHGHVDTQVTFTSHGQRRYAHLTARALDPDQPTADRTAILHLHDLTERVHAEHRVHSLNKLLSARDRELASALVRSRDVREEERRRLTRRLHDDAAQSLTAARMRLRHVLAALDDTPPVDDAALERVRSDAAAAAAALDAAVAATRGALRELTPAALERHGLSRAVRSYVAQAADRLPAAVAVDDDLGDQRLSTAVERAAYRTIVESLANVAKHAASASQVRVRLTPLPRGGVEVAVADDGPGPDPDVVASRVADGHLGVATLREDAAALGGSFTLAARPGGGAVAVAVFPDRDAHTSEP